MTEPSPMAEMFAVNMLANTESGNTYTEAQYREWLTDEGKNSKKQVTSRSRLISIRASSDIRTFFSWEYLLYQARIPER